MAFPTKNVKLIFLIVTFSFSCSTPDVFGLQSTDFFYSDQKRELIRMTDNFVGSETTGEGASELLTYRSSRMISSTWQASHGPGLDYRLANN